MANREIKFRAWDGERMFYDIGLTPIEVIVYGQSNKMIHPKEDWGFGRDTVEIMQYLILTDSEDTEIYIGDILEFENGDRIVIKMEEWLEPFAEAIGEPECEDQWRDLYRIERAKIIGNIYETPHLLK